ncbi:MAG: hypothetical protein PHU95_04955 [Candidatus Thermoplasmatota archaeon]|nr:hypothetical protein [Candidatus Thermoplasmatota archaeon]MDD5778777.1 hypothetical protein [Candidatus Thermoplasmatota archaeon]
MERPQTAVVLFLVLTSAFLAGCLGSQSQEPLSLASVSTDKASYAFGSSISMTVEVRATDMFDDVTIRVRGLQNTMGDYKLTHRQVVHTSPGIQEFVIQKTIPPCSSCTKLDPGTYHITVALIYREQEVDSKTVEVELYQ